MLASGYRILNTRAIPYPVLHQHAPPEPEVTEGNRVWREPERDFDQRVMAYYARAFEGSEMTRTLRDETAIVIGFCVAKYRCDRPSLDSKGCTEVFLEAIMGQINPVSADHWTPINADRDYVERRRMGAAVLRYTEICCKRISSVTEFYWKQANRSEFAEMLERAKEEEMRHLNSMDIRKWEYSNKAMSKMSRAIRQQRIQAPDMDALTMTCLRNNGVFIACSEHCHQRINEILNEEWPKIVRMIFHKKWQLKMAATPEIEEIETHKGL